MVSSKSPNYMQCIRILEVNFKENVFFFKRNGDKNDNSLSKEMWNNVNSKIFFETNNEGIVAKELCIQKVSLSVYLRTALNCWKQNLM